jgi:arginine exporter protein ArgO
MDDPIKRPRAERIARYSGIAIAYLMSGLLVLIAVSFTILWALMHAHIPLLKTCLLCGFVFVCWYMAAVLKAQAGRDRMKL